MNRIELIKFYDYLADKKVITDQEVGKAFRWIDNFINSMSEGERQPVGNNEQGVSKCIPLFHNSAIKYYGQCGKCGQATEM
jgi:hypothetical protein